MDAPLRYIVITTARNEEKTIEYVIRSVANQTIKPTLHVVADDASTDKTVEISRKNNAAVYETGNPRIPYKGHNQALGFIGAVPSAATERSPWVPGRPGP